MYVQIHSVEFGNPGDIRGQILAVPEPSTVLGMLFAVGLGAWISDRNKTKTVSNK
ncbi:PEP-CTERM sorting domain-containing protein [Moorena sp. SIO4G3]|uniref:PEP-CTERM sorting domain-containing protein n=1 Tax=Moorena sp. SIO4G3 TaxID=2607821 RepID=UPI00142B0033|nr:PEP-CTERM sorting domain-containing protein [Moorena sp. SIO4G3]NEO79228.1 PEP-CTERM sorting domain-containing protein [Moorena sp. SIO4G3]